MIGARRRFLRASGCLFAAGVTPIAHGQLARTVAAGRDSNLDSPAIVSREVQAAEAPKSRLLRVGPRRSITSLREAAGIAGDGTVIELDAGTYLNDVASWSQRQLTIRAVGGRARLAVQGASAEAKAIFVVKGDAVVVENIDFVGARVPSRNGAGIRHEGGKLTVRNCVFQANEMGLLTWNQPKAELIIESSEFHENAVARNHRPGEPIGHQIYAGSIARFTLIDSYVHRGAFGHLVKSRAKENCIINNRITDEASGRASYELDFPNGGVAFVVGNIIEQSAQTENDIIVAFGAEGYAEHANSLYLVNNTMVDDLPDGGIFLRVWPGSGEVRTINNLLIGRGEFATAGSAADRGNFHAQPSDVASKAGYDYRLKRGCPLVGKAQEPGEIDGVKLRPDREYVHPRRSRSIPPGPYSPGAMQSLAD